MKPQSRKNSTIGIAIASLYKGLAIGIMASASAASADTWGGATGTITSGSGSKIGVNTTTPQQRLSLGVAAGGTENVFGQFVAPTTFPSSHKLRVGGGDGAGAADWSGMQVLMNWTGATAHTSQLGFFTGSNTTNSEKMTILSNGRVGVGMTNPAAKFEVSGGGAADGAIRASQGYLEVDGLNANAGVAGGTNNLRIGWPVTGRVGFNLQGSERLSLLTSGRIGVGTTNPGMKFEVAGGGAADGALKLSQGFMEIDGINATAALNGGTNNFRLGFPVSGKLAFNLQGSERFAIMTNGNVGINTAGIHSGAPVSAFEVNGFGVEGGGIRIQNGYFEADGVDGAANNNGGQNNLRIGWPVAGRVGYNLQGVEVVTMLTTGRVGVGVTNPAMKLEVGGGGAADGALKLSQGFMEVDGVNASAAVNGGTNNFRLGFPVNGKLAFNLQGNERFAIMTNGNVGINTAGIHGGVPVTAFEVNGFGVEGGGLRTTSGYFEADGINASASANGGTNNLRIGWPATGRVGYTLQGTEVMSMTIGGQVGIGKTAPVASLHISKTNSSGQSIGLILENETTAGYGSALIFHARNASDQTVEMARIVGEGKAGILRFYTRNSGGTVQERMTLNEAGDLNVPAAIIAGSIKTKVWSIAPDYVFEKGYKLNTLEHVEKYVNENKHLPEIPSAKEINDKGIDLAEMNMKLLQKVEELTLHAIRQEKELKNQASKISRLEAKGGR